MGARNNQLRTKDGMMVARRRNTRPSWLKKKSEGKGKKKKVFGRNQSHPKLEAENKLQGMQPIFCAGGGGDMASDTNKTAHTGLRPSPSLTSIHA